MSVDTRVVIRPIEQDDRPWVRAEMRKWWGNEIVVLREKKYYPAEMGGLIAILNGEGVGLAILRYEGSVCEIMSLTMTDKHTGIGKKLLDAAIADARKQGAERMTVVTTNDNTGALRFYQQRGFSLNELRKGILEKSRRIKPEIPQRGNFNIPIRDEIELELFL